MFILSILMAACQSNDPQPAPESRSEDGKYKVKKVSSAPIIDGNWDKPFWADKPVLTLGHYMGEKPAHFPNTQARLAYDKEAVYVIFKVEDQFVRAVADTFQGPVYRDSCVEFFFTPGENLSEGYFNLEMNCGGTALFNHQVTQGNAVQNISKADFGEMTIVASLPRIIDPEITEPTTWTVEYRLPIDILKTYAPVKSPASGVIWRANFFKCADATSQPHWLTWAKVDHPTPRFHLPEFFGEIAFE